MLLFLLWIFNLIFIHAVEPKCSETEYFKYRVALQIEYVSLTSQTHLYYCFLSARCEHRCGAKYNESASCQCNEHCTDIGDCCEDYKEKCYEGNWILVSVRQNLRIKFIMTGQRLAEKDQWLSCKIFVSDVVSMLDTYHFERASMVHRAYSISWQFPRNSMHHDAMKINLVSFLDIKYQK